MRLPSRTRRSRPISNKLWESAASAGVRRLPVRPESKRTRECRGRKFRLDRKVARRGNRFAVIAERAPLRAREDRPIGRTRLIQLDKLWRRLERARSFVDRNKTCI